MTADQHSSPLPRRRLSDEWRHAAAAPAGVVEHRETVYGPPEESFTTIAARWTLVLGITVTPAQVALCLIDLKLARLTRDPSHLDSMAAHGPTCALAQIESEDYRCLRFAAGERRIKVSERRRDRRSTR